MLGEVLLEHTVDLVTAQTAGQEGALSVAKVLEGRGDLFDQLGVGDSLREGLGDVLLNLWFATAKEFGEEV